MIIETQIKNQMLIDSMRGIKYDDLDPKLKKKILRMNSPINERKELETYVWYKADPDSLQYFYQYTLKNYFIYDNKDLAIRRVFKDYFWTANNEKVKKTHSGIGRIICDTIANCVSCPTTIAVNDNPSFTQQLEEINDQNDFKSFLSSQISEMVGLGNAAIFVDIVDGQDYPVYNLVSGLYVDFEFLGNTVKSISKRQFYQKGTQLYELIETRSTTKIETNGKSKTCATIEYRLFKVQGDRLKEVDLMEIEDTAKLVTGPRPKGQKWFGLIFENIPFILAVPCIWNKSSDKDRGESIFANSIGLMDDFDQNISQESTIMRASTPVENIDTRSLEYDKEGHIIPPDVFGKHYAFYQSNENAGENIQPPTTSFFEANFQNLSSESLETMMRILSGKISPATLGYSVAKNESDLSQREKEKVTMKTVGKVIDIEEKILKKLFNIALALKQLMQDENASYDKQTFTINFPAYASESFESKATTLAPLFAAGMISPEKVVEELWGDSLSNDDRKKEIEYIKSKQTSTIDNFEDFSERNVY